MLFWFLEGPMIFADNFFGSLQFLMRVPFLFFNTDQVVQVGFLFSFVVQIALKLQIFCEDPQFLLAFGHCPLVQNPNL